MPTIDFQVNQFRTYKAMVDGISLGFIDTGTGSYNPQRGEEIKYDGTTVVLKDGREFGGVPQLRGAILSGWFVPVDDKVTTYSPKSAGIQVRATEQRGQERVAKSTVATVRAEEREVGSVETRRINREKTNHEASRRVPLESQAAREAMHVHAMASAPGSSGDAVVDGFVLALEQELQEWFSVQIEPEVDLEASLRARAEADIIELLGSIADDTESTPAPARQLGRTPALPVRQDNTGFVGTGIGSARALPVERDEVIRRQMPVTREEQMENAGPVVGTVAQHRARVEQEQSTEINVAPAKPATSPSPRPRFGGGGAIVVDDQRDLGNIMLSDGRSPIHIDESAKVVQSPTESVRMGAVEVGPRNKSARNLSVEGGDQQGVPIGRVLSPAVRKFTATDANTSQDAINRAQEGTTLKVEKLVVPQQEGVAVSRILTPAVRTFTATDANTSSTAITRTEGGTSLKVEKLEPARAIATGDVQEVRAGDELTDLLPDAATSPPLSPPKVEEVEDPAYAAVRIMLPDFQWNRDRPLKERVADALAKFKDPMFVKGVLHVETEMAREEIKKGLAELLKKGKAKTR
jgi:hypothetical protein